jgi:uncharacterized protein (TIGR03437 family)
MGFHQVRLGLGGKTSTETYREVPVGNLIQHGSTLTYSSNLFGGTPPSSPPAGRSGPAAPESILTAFSCGAPFVHGTGATLENARNPATTLGGITVKVKDSLGVERLAPVLYALPRPDFRPDRVDYIVPSGTSEGRATVTLTRPDGTVSTGNLEIQTIAPSIFDGFARCAGGTCCGVCARASPAWNKSSRGLLRSGSQLTWDPETDQVFLVLFGTGWA